ncbi:hypothetical protein PCANC_10170 [Puccinia coronata f. sp. avenae]|uniref:DUF4939 domain-containing protein n=1 Tax=Puccinia coronata f. sp. avenae TaxID=200324 RepID=A0A2N5T3F4_9BASI|nr:hypothetical protein PCANC_10170 [Puccinia coronata f. sp. avenae]
MSTDNPQRQLKELMAVVNKEPKANTTLLTTASGKGPKVSVPNKFNGTRGTKAKVYMNQVGLYVVSNPTMFPDNRSQLIFSLWYLTGAASAWAQPFTVKVFDGADVSYEEFSMAFQAMYFDSEKKTCAEKALQAL